MLSECSDGQNRDVDIIILGNAGAGKSFICNLLLGDKLCKEDYNPEAVTTATQYHLIPCDPYNIRIYDIPGLVESNQKKIDRNKAQINIAFEQCEYAFVMFVWSQRGGRVVYEDIIAFKALDEAYHFPRDSLIHVVNNISQTGQSQYDTEFVAKLSSLLDPTAISMANTYFLARFDAEDKQSFQENRSKLYFFIGQHHACQQNGPHGIILYLDWIKTLKAALKSQQDDVERDNQTFQRQMEQLVREHNKFKEDAEKQCHTLELEQGELTRSTRETRYPHVKDLMWSVFQQQFAASDHVYTTEVQNETEKYYKSLRELENSYQSGLDKAKASHDRRGNEILLNLRKEMDKHMINGLVLPNNNPGGSSLPRLVSSLLKGIFW